MRIRRDPVFCHTGGVPFLLIRKGPNPEGSCFVSNPEESFFLQSGGVARRTNLVFFASRMNPNSEESYFLPIQKGHILPILRGPFCQFGKVPEG